MAKAKNTLPPFAWLGRYWMPVGLFLVVTVAAFFRFYQLDSLPPGLDETSAAIGLQALNLHFSNAASVVNAGNGFSTLWVWLQTTAVHALGHTVLSLRIWSATLGTLAVLAMWFWLRDWFHVRVAWVGAFALAVSPWAVMISRSGLETALFPLLVPLTLWLGGRAYRSATAKNYALLGAAIALDVFSGPIGWLLSICVIALAIWKLAATHQLVTKSPIRAIAGAIAVVCGLINGYLIVNSHNTFNSLPHTLNLTFAPTTLWANTVKVLLMFNVHGDENYRHNLAGEPMLNAFLGLMLVAGLLVTISRLHALRYRVVLILTIVLLAPAVFTIAGQPNASWAVGALPLIFALVGIGTAYMLELWYATFPINSAARATGQAAIILLLALSLLQGYTQYFRAWAGSSAVYVAYDEGATQIAAHLRADKFTGERFAVVPAEQTPVIGYLDYDLNTYRTVTPAALASLPIATGNRQFYIVAASRDESVKTLKAKFPGGVLRPHYSNFNQIETYYTYETTK